MVLSANGKLGHGSHSVVVGGGERAIKLNVMGSTSRGGAAPNEDLTYVNRELGVGDAVTIRIVEDGTATAAERTPQLTYEELEREEFARSKEYYLENRNRFEPSDG